MNIVFESAPEGTTHFLRYTSGYIVWCKIDEGQNNQLILSEWDSGNEYWVPGIFPVERYQKIGLASIDDLPTQSNVGPDAVAPKGATHCYQHGGETSWYRETEDNLFVWRDGSWYASPQKSAADLARVCPFGAVTILTQEVQLADDSEDDLTWLVRNVHEWPTETDFVFVGIGIKHGNMGWYPADYCFSRSSLVTRQQWLARRAELQGKPSWKDAPEWAQWVGQDEDGVWYWHGEEPNTKGEDVNGCRYWMSCGLSDIARRGELLGDWRDTLERQPADLSEPAVTERLTEATENVLAAAPALMDEKFSFDRGDWFERGELPPVGVECEFHGGARFGCGWPNSLKDGAKVKVLCHYTPIMMPVAVFSFDTPGGKLTSQASEVCFRPIRTERELAIEEMKQHCPYHGSWDAVGRIYAEALYDAGYRKEAK